MPLTLGPSVRGSHAQQEPWAAGACLERSRAPREGPVRLLPVLQPGWGRVRDTGPRGFPARVSGAAGRSRAAANGPPFRTIGCDNRQI